MSPEGILSWPATRLIGNLVYEVDLSPFPLTATRSRVPARSADTESRLPTRSSRREEALILSESLALLNGVLSGELARLHYVTAHPYFPWITDPTTLDYTVRFTDNVLWLDGSMRSQPRCCDIPYAFIHAAVEAVRRPDLTITLLAGDSFEVTTNQVFPGDAMGLRWKGSNSVTDCISVTNSCPERFGPALGSTYRILTVNSESCG